MKFPVVFIALAGLVVAGCGSHAKRVSSTTTTVAQTPTAPATTTTSAASTSPGALQAEATSLAAGDIPDNQVFVTYHGSRFSMKYPEGWAQAGGAASVTIRDKNNIVRVVVSRGAPSATTASLAAELKALHGVTVTTAPHAVTVGRHTAVAATYRTTSAPNPVTGKRVTLTVDRYELASGGSRATVDLGTPVGVDNVDAYRLMIQSFKWK